MNSACNCCEKFPVDIFKVEFRQKRVGVGWCGFGVVQEDGTSKYYKEYRYVRPDQNQFLGTEGGWLGTETVTFIDRIEYDQSNPYNCIQFCTQTIPDGVFDEFCGPSPPYDDGASFGDLIEGSEQYLDEITPEETKGYVEQVYSEEEFGPWGDTVSDLFSYSYQRATRLPSGNSRLTTQFRIKHPPSATGYLKIWFVKIPFTWVDGSDGYWTSEGGTIYGDDNSEYLFTEAETFYEYVWSGEPQDPSKSINDVANQITSEEIEFSPEEDNVGWLVLMSKYSMIKGYEPSDPIKFNPYTRPDPDCFSNNIPTVNESCPASLFDA